MDFQSASWSRTAKKNTGPMEDGDELCNPYMGVSINRGTPKWMVMTENPIKVDALGVPLFLETPIYQPGVEIEGSQHQSPIHILKLTAQDAPPEKS